MMIIDRILRNGDKITSSTMHHSFRPPLPNLPAIALAITSKMLLLKMFVLRRGGQVEQI